MSRIYYINKGINQPVEFRGLKAQYIWWLGGGILGLLFLFAVLYISGVNMYMCVVGIPLLGIGLFGLVYKMNKQHGEYGLMKKRAGKCIPKIIKYQ